ncbi:MAG: HAMP domain-containing protein [Treponema sp.]|jgi:class 3 adenylate cyclase|nr:HAMP domain-containing protein [Treponema sp.]
MQKKKAIILFIPCTVVLVSCIFTCLLNLKLLARPVFQKKTVFFAPSIAKYEQDNNIYVVDNGAFRLICMTPEGRINYIVNIDKIKQNIKFYDLAVDEEGNLFVYALEAEYDAFLTKRDIIRQYDKNGKFVRDVFVVNYNDDSPGRPHIFPQFGSLCCRDGVLTFSRVLEDSVSLYAYDISRNILSSSVFSEDISDYSVGRLTLKDFDNFIYTTRDGDIFEVKNGGAPVLRQTFNFTQDEGGIIPWYLDYDSGGNIVFFDMISSVLYRIDGNNVVEYACSVKFFDYLREMGVSSVLCDFGFWKDHFAGVYGETVWYFDAGGYKTYEEGIILSLGERAAIAAVQFSFVLGIAAFIFWIYLLFIKILDKYLSLFLKQIVVIIPMTAAACIILYNITFNLMMDRVNREIFKELNSVAALSSMLVSGDDIDSVRSIKDFRSEGYRRISATLKEILGGNRNEWNRLFYVGVYKIIDGVEYFLMLGNDEVNPFRPYGYVKEGTPEYWMVYAGQQFANIVSNPTGVWAYANIPINNSAGKFAGFLEIGFDMTSYEIANERQHNRISLVAALICLVILVVLIAVIAIIVRNLSAVVKVLEAITTGNYTARVKYRARDELGMVGTGLNTMADELRNQFMRINNLNESTLRFVPVQFMEHLGVTDITKMKLGDHVQRDITVLFFDIRAFSINSEMMTAKENFNLINEILSIAGPIIRKHNGFVDKYIGDAAMALFINAKDAVLAGIDLYRDLVLRKETRVKVGVDSINIGVGLHSGSVMMGIVGEEKRLSSTVISPNVNLASRVESLTKQTHSGMLITRDTLNQISGSEEKFKYRFIGMVQAAGVNTVVGLFDILDALPAPVRARRIATKKVFESGIRRYHMKEYGSAIKRFEAVIKADPSDICAANCLAETRKRLENPNLPSIFVFDKK